MGRHQDTKILMNKKYPKSRNNPNQNIIAYVHQHSRACMLIKTKMKNKIASSQSQNLNCER
jgi:hypothetical protein